MTAQLIEKGIDVAEAAAVLGNADADPFDILCNLAWDMVGSNRRFAFGLCAPTMPITSGFNFSTRAE